MFAITPYKHTISKIRDVAQYFLFLIFGGIYLPQVPNLCGHKPVQVVFHHIHDAGTMQNSGQCQAGFDPISLSLSEQYGYQS